MGTIITDTITLVTIECSECHITFAIPYEMNERCLKLGNSWYCPNGHSQVYCKSELTKTKEKLENERKLRADTEAALHFQIGSNRSLRGVITKTKKRVSKGICPCCNRQFLDMTRHMETQHPGYGKEATRE